MWVAVKTGLLSHYVFIAAVAVAISHLPAMFLHTFCCGGLCATHGILLQLFFLLGKCLSASHERSASLFTLGHSGCFRHLALSAFAKGGPTKTNDTSWYISQLNYDHLYKNQEKGSDIRTRHWHWHWLCFSHFFHAWGG